ncbi:E3 ubiquitin-protein ligase TRIM71-like [Ptychodera flava]|uniref:E3 ubiquitin-protein ligase TRIM71-like n=1 Tax=Ptychodera flava TaxID=63121 RepID=UPI00396AAB9A
MATGGMVRGRTSSRPSMIRENILQCSICFEQYKDPRHLPCQHSFCAHCLSTYVRNANTVRCPSCNQIWDVQPGGVDKFPPNYLLNELIDIVGNDDEGADTQCSICKAHPTCAVCVDCDKGICEHCVDNHREIPITKEHRVYPIEEVRNVKEKDDSLIQRGELCKSHKENALDMYCETCKVPLCETCSDLKHRSHNCMRIFNCIKDYQSSLSGYLARMKVKHEKYIRRMKVSENTLEVIGNLCEQQLTLIRAQANALTDVIQKECERLSGDLKDSFDREKYIIEQELLASEVKEKTISNVISTVEDLQKYGTPAQIMLSNPLVEQYTIDIEASAICKYSGGNKMPVFVPTPRPSADNLGVIKHNYLQANCVKIQIKNAGVIREGYNVYGYVEFNWETELQHMLMPGYINASIEYPDSQVREIELEKGRRNTINLKVKSEGSGNHVINVKLGDCDVEGSPCSFPAQEAWKNVGVIGSGGTDVEAADFEMIRGVAVDTKGRLIIGDGAKRLLRMNSKGRERKTLIPETKSVFPQYIAISRDGSVVFTNANSNDVLKLSKKGKIKSFSKTKELDQPLGIAVSDLRGKVYVASRGKKKLLMFDKDGTHLKSLDEELPETSKLLKPYGVAVDSKGHVIVSDRGKHCLQVYDDQCNPLFTFGSQGNNLGEFNQPEGVAIDKHDNIYVCDTGNNRVQKFDQLGRFVCCVNEASSLDAPSGVAVDDDSGRVYVTGYKAVYVFE